MPDGLGAEINLDAVPVPPVFGWLAAQANITEPEMLRTFNCGVGMVLVVDAGHAAEIITGFERQKESVAILGTLVERDAGDPVSFVGKLAV